MRQSSFTALLTPTGELLPDIKDLPFYEVVIEKQEVFTAPGEKMNSIGKIILSLTAFKNNAKLKL